MVNATDRPVVIAGVTYGIGEMDAMTQWHVARRLSPILGELGGAFKRMAASKLFADVTGQSLPEPTPEQMAAATTVAENPETEVAAPEEEQVSFYKDEKVLELFDILAKPLTTAISTMSDSDSEYVIKRCLDVCRRRTGPAWARIIDQKSGAMMYQDINMRTMIELTVRTVMENLGDFFPTSL